MANFLETWLLGVKFSNWNKRPLFKRAPMDTCCFRKIAGKYFVNATVNVHCRVPSSADGKESLREYHMYKCTGHVLSSVDSRAGDMS